MNKAYDYIHGNIINEKVESKKFKDSKFYFGKFIVYTMNKVNQSDIKSNMFRNNIVKNFLETENINLRLSKNPIINDINIIINEAVKNQYDENIFIEKVKNINNLDKATEIVKERVEDQIVDTINQNKRYKEKMDDMIKNIENKITDGEIKESYYDLKVNEGKKQINNVHKYTLTNVIAQKLSENSFKENDTKYCNDNILDLNEVYKDSTDIYILFEIMNTFGFNTNIIDILN